MIRLLIALLRALAGHGLATAVAGSQGASLQLPARPATGPAQAPLPGPRAPAATAHGKDSEDGDNGDDDGEDPPPDLAAQPPPRQRQWWRRVPRWARWGAVIIVIAVFRRASAWLVISVLSGLLHLAGVSVSLPHVSFGWPWQSLSHASARTVTVGPWVLSKIQGIDKPALGTENFTFMFTRKVSHDIGPWPCWYQASFYAVGHASATVTLNPGPAWWKAAAGHYALTVTRPPAGGEPGTVSVVMTLPQPQLPSSVHDVTIDDTASQPLNVQHSWTYPGMGCGVLLKPQFSPTTLYPLAQQQAFTRATTDPSVTGPMIKAAQDEAVKIIRDNFIAPTVGALGYTLGSFTLRWAPAS